MDRTQTGERITKYMEELMRDANPLKPSWNREQTQETYVWTYVSALVAGALLRLYGLEGRREYLSCADNFMDAYVRNDGSIRACRRKDYNIDHICGGTVLVELYRLTGKEKYRLGAQYLMMQLQSQPRTVEGNFWHKNIYPDQVWLDGLYMAQPFYMRYGAEHGNDNICRDSYRQFVTVQRRMRDRETGLYYHGYDASRRAFWSDPATGLSKSFWLRSIGWLAMAYVDTAEAMPPYMGEERRQMAGALRELAEAMLRYRDGQSRMWYQVPDRGDAKGNYLETGGSAMMAYAMLKGSRLHMLEERYQLLGRETFDGIAKTMLCEEDSRLCLNGICLAAGLGGEKGRRDGSYEYYISEPAAEGDGKGTGPFILAYSELLHTV